MPYISERSLFTRERNDGLYTTFTSLAGKMFDELVINAIVRYKDTCSCTAHVQRLGIALVAPAAV